MSSLGFLSLQISETFNATYHLKKRMWLQNFLKKTRIFICLRYDRIGQDYFQMLEVLHICNIFVETRDLCYVLLFNDEDSASVLVCAWM